MRKLDKHLGWIRSGWENKTQFTTYIKGTRKTAVIHAKSYLKRRGLDKKWKVGEVGKKKIMRTLTGKYPMHQITFIRRK